MSNVPKLRFGEFNGEWTEHTLAELTKINQGLQIPISERFTGQVENSYFYITNEFLKAGSAKKYFIKNPPLSVICDQDDILMTRTGNTGQVVTNTSGAFHNNFFKIKYSASVTKNFLVAFLRLPKTQHTILSYAGTSTIPDLNHGDFYRLKIRLPALEEQQKIADFLTAVDTKIEQLTRKEELLKQYKKGVMQKFFSQEIRFKADDGSEFPEWEKKALGDLYSDLKTGSTPSRYNSEYFKGNIPWITSGELNYRPIYRTAEKISDNAMRETSLKLYPAGTFFIAITGLEAPGTRGKCAISAVPATTNQSCMAFQEKEEIHTPFLYYWYRFFGISLYYKYAQGTKQQSFNNKIVESFSIDLPSKAEQQKIADALAVLSKKIEVVNAEISTAKTFKKGLLQQMFV